MSPELQIAVQAAVVAIGGIVSLTSRAALTELRKISSTVEEHGRALATGNEKFRGIAKELEQLRDELRELKRGRGRRREER